MVKILLNGCNGKMGKVISATVAERFENAKIVAGIDIVEVQNFDYPVFSDPEKVDVEADVIIDFSFYGAVDKIVDYAVAKDLPIVVATTGLSGEHIAHIDEAAKSIPVFRSANMSIGVNLISELAKKAAEVLGYEFDIEIVEAHHNQKIDAPSGTALMLADSINESRDNAMKYEFDRHSKRQKRTVNEIGIHSVRGGTIVGEHEVIFAGNDEVIKISHSAASKQIFATGSINAALFLVSQKPGLYSMKDMLN
ncbi:MAG: 4-hydroxy-tetrahydrodipicolinate reductase [Clostridia bacterium]|nr:4-hydroxy-tetrahydrodipicolinate reductase [Clostridia bacterium]